MTGYKKKIICVLLAALLCVMPLMVPVEAADYYSESDLSNIKATILSNSTRANYVNTMMKYHILSSTDNYRIARNLQNGSNVVFFFDGCSDNMDSATYSDYTRYHLSAYCAVVKVVGGVPQIIYESENCSTIPDNPRNVSLNEGSAVPTVLDGVYNILSTNHLSRYAALRIADNSGSAPVMRCTSSSSYISTSSAINIHARSNFSNTPTNGVSSISYSSTGCFLVGLTNNTWSEYNQFTNAVLGIPNAIITTPYSSGSWTKCSAGADKGVVVVDRANYKTQLQEIYGGDNNNTATSLVNRLTQYTDNLNVDIPEPASRPVDKAYADYIPIHAYPISTGNVNVYDENGNVYSGRFITGSTDLCIIKQIYSDGWCYVSYPSTVEADGYAEAYVPLSSFIVNPEPQTWSADEPYTAYRRSDLSEKLGSIDYQDACLEVDANNNAKQVIYPVSGSGYSKMGWIDAAVPEPVLRGISISAPPEKTSYLLGETLLTDGLTLSASFDDGSTQLITDGYTCSPMLLETVGTQTITVTYEGFSTVFFVEVLNPAVLEPSISLKYPTVSFEDEIYMSVYFDVKDIPNVDTADMGMLIFDNAVSEGDIQTADRIVAGGSLNSNGFYSVRSPRIAAKNLGDEIWFCVYIQLADGSYLYGPAVSYSPQNYAYSVLNGAYSDEMKALAAAMLNYGTEAQLYFDYQTDSLVNAQMTAEDHARVKTYSSDMVSTITAVPSEKQGDFLNSGDYSSRYATVSFEGAFLINFYFEPKETVNGEMRLVYWTLDAFASENILTMENASGSVLMSNTDGVFGAAIDDIAAKDLNIAVYVAGIYTDEQGQIHPTGVLGYSIGAYCASKASGGEGTQGPLARATAVYGYHADAYFN